MFRGLGSDVIDLRTRISPGIERLWGLGRLGTAGAVLVGTFLLLPGNPAFSLFLGLMLFALAYGAGALFLIAKKKIFQAFVLGFVLDSSIMLFAWWRFLDLNRGRNPTDMYLVILPVTVMGIVRLGPSLGLAYAALWLAWLTWTSIYYYGTGSYPMEQLPVRLAFIGVSLAVVARLIAVLDRERALERTRLEQLERLEKMKSDLLRAISHELRTPLTAVKTAGELLVSSSMTLTGAQEQAAQDALRSGVARLQQLTEQALRYAAATRPQDVLPTGLVDFPRLVEAVTEAMRPSFASRHQEVRFHSSGDVPHLRIDPDLVSVVLFSILDNAHRYTPEQTQITVRVERAGDDACVTVVDDGPGIAPEDLPFVFQEFYRGPRPDRHKNRGLGLGLPSAKHLMELQGGSIEILSEHKEGTRVVLRLPLPTALTTRSAPDTPAR